MSEVLQPRDRAYLDLLYYGLILLRNYSYGGRVELWRAEAEHLHEVPRLVGEASEYQHTYYLRGTRGLYLQQLREIGDPVYLEQVAIWYTGPWQVLAEAAGVELTE
jgi:hypothetical protein